MSNGSFVTLKDLDERIAIVRDNIRQLIEQAAAQSGAGDEDRNAERIAQQQAELNRLTTERDNLQRETLLATPATPKPKAQTKQQTPKAKQPKAKKQKPQKRAAKAARKKPPARKTAKKKKR